MAEDLFDFTLSIPTCRPTKVGVTVEAYDQHFKRYDHTVPIIIFDDSKGDQVRRYLEGENYHFNNPVYVVGQTEKSQFLTSLSRKIVSLDREQSILEKLLRPSFGGNRNHMVLYSLGGMFMAVDDDILPYGLVTPSFNQSEQEKEVMIRGHSVSLESFPHRKKEEDIWAAFKEVLGKKVGSLNGFVVGQHVYDPKAELYKNKSQALATEESIFYLVPARGDFSSATVKMAETGLSGTDNLDSLDFAYYFLNDRRIQDLRNLRNVFVLSTQRAFVTKDNWKNACGVSGYDNTTGLPPFFPTTLRFENYAYRLWIQREDLASAHVKALQHHNRDAHERASLASEIVNEEFANFLKGRLRLSLQKIDDTSMQFGYEGEITEREVQEILDLGRRTYSRVKEEMAVTTSGIKRGEQLRVFARELKTEFRDFDYSLFRRRMEEIVHSELESILQSQKLWPRCVESAQELKLKRELPLRKIN